MNTRTQKKKNSHSPSDAQHLQTGEHIKDFLYFDFLKERGHLVSRLH